MHDSSGNRIHLETRDELRRIATHVLARAQFTRAGRFGLRATVGGIGTPTFGDADERLRISNGSLIREARLDGVPTSQAVPLVGATLRDLAEFAHVDLAVEFSVGHDTPPLGDVEAPIELDAASERRVAAWFGLVAEALDRAVADSPGWSRPSFGQLWPEHFDLALDVAFDESSPEERRVNLGGAPGDDFSPLPYLYVGPWTPDRPGDPSFWNAPFGAAIGVDALDVDDPVGAAVDFFRHGIDVLTR